MELILSVVLFFIAYWLLVQYLVESQKKDPVRRRLDNLSNLDVTME